jgi:hypothetical protein
MTTTSVTLQEGAQVFDRGIDDQDVKALTLWLFCHCLLGAT